MDWPEDSDVVPDGHDIRTSNVRLRVRTERRPIQDVPLYELPDRHLNREKCVKLEHYNNNNEYLSNAISILQSAHGVESVLPQICPFKSCSGISILCL